MERQALITIEEDPYNGETPLAALKDTDTPSSLVYVRNHNAVPQIDGESWRLSVEGAVANPLELAPADLHGLEHRSVLVTMECAGNGRMSMDPRPSGTPWNLGAVSTVSFTGVSLREVLESVRPDPAAVEVMFEGADWGEVEPGREETYRRSIPGAVARHPDTLLAWEMGGVPLSQHHGAPLRLVVPGWYGMASVKWLTRIVVLAKPFDGYYQRERYVYLGEEGTPEGTPVSLMRVRSVIAEPHDGAVLPAGPIEIAGTAWSGGGRIVRVEVSVDGGTTWMDSELGRPASAYGATPWRLTAPAQPGAYPIMSRAIDESGARQPERPVWNELGYGNNAVQTVRVDVSRGRL